jgi:DNA modification methylase
MKRELFQSDGTSRGFYSERNRLNDLTGREWVYWTRSVINRPYPTNCQHRLRRQHGGQKPPDLCAELIKVFSKAGQRVLDPFAGVGGTLLGAALCGREAVGVELNGRWIDVYREVCALEGLREMPLLAGDAADVLGSALPPFDVQFDLVLTDVPYWNMDVARRSTGTFKRVGEAARSAPATRLSPFGDAAGYASKASWLAAMQAVFARAAGLLRDGGYLLSFIGDMYFDGEYHCLSAELAESIRQVPGLRWQANLVWYDVAKKLHIYGYQYRYIPSMVHQNVLVFRKST